MGYNVSGTKIEETKSQNPENDGESEEEKDDINSRRAIV